MRRLRLPPRPPSKRRIRAELTRIREHTLRSLDNLNGPYWRKKVRVPGVPFTLSVRFWMHFVLEHEIHHKAQLSLYLRLIGIEPPFFAIPLPAGRRPDIEARRTIDRGGSH